MVRVTVAEACMGGRGGSASPMRTCLRSVERVESARFAYN